MLSGLLHRWRQRREQRQLAQFAIPEPLWQLTLAHYPFIARRSEADRTALRRLCSLFLASKEFHGARGFIVTDEVAVAVAAQACLPVLRLGLSWYDGFVGIVMHEGEVVAPRETMDDDGVVHAYDEALVGEAHEGGPLMLAWSEITPEAVDRLEGHDAVYNVVIHEFAHVIDACDGAVNGSPALATAHARQQWHATMEAEWAWFCDQVDAGASTLIDPYGAEAPEEFFAVAVEAFFVAPRELLMEQPRLYRLLAEFFQQDPAQDGD
ncbi:zinc-dependent peptidase [Roseateles amylovorans]|uniref:Zinc-dependent peptidase n=1 Tax=Roseateles amylovorans TaxID=2978473 RepID=A0ABY6B6V3_9BURK|nr:M90 family metallopeptidase [Roseateles amylovorans]UXH80063.1 zinc-dependent peptidase [Roseateles amylovorans]